MGSKKQVIDSISILIFYIFVMGTYVPDNTIKKIRGSFALNSGELRVEGESL